MTEITIRSYCHGFGDCSLLRIPRNEGEDFKIIIDCGLLKNTRDEKVRLREVISSLKEDVSNHVDVLVITHEHYDHLSGFGLEESWKGLTVDQIWMAWTEDPHDPLAQSLEVEKSLTSKALTQAVSERPFSASVSEAKSLLAFSEGTRELRKFVTETLGSNGAKVKYFLPGERVQLPLTGWEVLFLGPPRDKAKLRKLDEKAHRRNLDFQLGISELPDKPLFRAKEQAVTKNNASDYEQAMRSLLGLTAARQTSVFSSEYLWDRKETEVNGVRNSEVATKLEKEMTIEDSYRKDRWRTLGEDGEHSLSDFALQLDSMTNNTSLVMAFTKDRKALLFPGDAQAGNWMSWGAALAPEGDSSVTLAAGEEALQRLLSQTVFYKVGHHGSHNGTFIKDRFDSMRNLKFIFMPFEPVSKWPSIPDPMLVAKFQKNEGQDGRQNQRQFVRGDESDKVKSPIKKGPYSDLLKRPLWVEFKIED